HTACRSVQCVQSRAIRFSGQSGHSQRKFRGHHGNGNAVCAAQCAVLVAVPVLRMRFVLRIFLCSLSVLCVSVVFFAQAPVTTETQSTQRLQREVRALWVVRTTLTSPEKIHQLVNAAAENGFNTLIVQIRGRGDAYYKSRVEPRANEL